MTKLQPAEIQNSPPTFPWYDSQWLTSYVAFKHHLAQFHPSRLNDFETLLAPLRTSPEFRLRLVPNLFDEATRDQLRKAVSTLQRGDLERHELLKFGRLIVHDHPLLTELQRELTPRVSEWVGEDVEPCYNFLSLYNNLGVCKVHMDAPASKWTLDYCIAQSEPWPIHFSDVIPWPENGPNSSDLQWEEHIKNDPDLRFTSYEMQENQALVFGGSSQWHYRDHLARQDRQNFCHLAFFHFIPKGTQNLMDPDNWFRLLGIPSLDGIVIPIGTISSMEGTQPLPRFLRTDKPL